MDDTSPTTPSSEPLPPETAPAAPPAVPKKPLWTRLKILWFKAWAGTQKFWANVRPGPEARRGAMILTGLVTLIYWGFMGHVLRAGLGPVFDIVVPILLIAIVLPLGAWVVQFVLWILSKLPRFAAGFVITGAILLGFGWHPAASVGVVLSNCILGGALASLFFGDFSRMALSRRIITVILVVVGAGADAATIYVFFQHEGTVEGLAAEAKLPPAMQIDAPNPAEPGPLAVRTLFYGSGADRHRPEYGKGVQLKTAPVDGSKLLKDKSGLPGMFRTWYWGFNTSKLPLNARVWYPDGPGPYPLVLVVHGNHLGQEYSDPGYEYLGRLLGSRGYIVASIDENFLNFDWLGDYQTAEQAARGWLLLEHLRLWHEWNKAPGNPFQNKVDLENIALIGHSRGGEASATAAAFNRLAYYPGDATVRFNYNYKIKSVIAIAPSDGQYMPAGMYRTLKDVNYFVIQGGHDPDVNIFLGSRQYQRTSFSEGSPFFKAELYVYRANHGQFNTVWGRYDFGPPGGWVLNTRPVMNGEDQRKIAKVYFSAFLDATLRGKTAYVPMFSDYRRATAWLPEAIYVNRYQDASFKLVAGYDEDFDLASTTLPGGSAAGEDLAVWREQRVHFRNWHRENNGVYLGWRKPEKGGKPATYTVSLPDDFAAAAKLNEASLVEFSMANAGEEPPPPEEKKDGKKQEGKKQQEKKSEVKKPEVKKAEVKKPEEKKEPLDFTVELVAKSGAVTALPASRFGPLHPDLKAQFFKYKFIPGGPGGKDSEPVLQRYALRLSELQGLNPASLKAIRFRFDRSPAGVIVVDDIGFSREYQPGVR